MTRWSKLGLASLSGLMLGIAFPPSPLYSTAYVALVPFLFLVERLEKYGQVLFYTYVMSFIFHALALYWIGGFTHGKDPYLMASGAAVALFHPTFYWVITVPYFFIRKHSGVGAGLLAFPFLWVSYDYTHSLSEFSFPWISLGNSQAFDLYRIQIAEYSSIYGPALIILIFNVLAFVLIVQLASKSWTFSSRPAMTVIAALLFLYLVPFFYGRTVMKNREVATSGKNVRVGIVQPNIDPWEKWGQGRASKWESYQRQLRLLVDESKHLAEGGAELIVWPETAIPFEILSPRFYDNWLNLKRQLDSLGVPVFTGLPAAEYFDSARAPVTAVRIQNTNMFVDYYNAATLINPGRGEGLMYKKMVLVPFAERVPYAETFSFLIEPLKWGVGISGWGKGEDQIVYRTQTRAGDELRFSGMVCYESVYPNFVREFVNRGAQLLLVITNDSWWGNTSGAYQHAAFASFRAIENRRWVVQCANGGISTFVDQLGVTRVSSEMYTPARIVNEIVPSNEITFYAKYGDVVAQFCLFCSALFLIIVLRKKFLSKPYE